MKNFKEIMATILLIIIGVVFVIVDVKVIIHIFNMLNKVTRNTVISALLCIAIYLFIGVVFFALSGNNDDDDDDDTDFWD